MSIVCIDYKTKYSSGHIEMSYELFKKKYAKIRRLFKDCEYLKVEEKSI